jgi:SAM-dependent methyltransferase
LITSADAWEQYAEKARPRRQANAAGARTWINWTQYPDHGPDESVLGDLAGRDVLELGSGSGANLAHLASLGARCVGVDIAPSRKVEAGRRWGGQDHLDFVTADAVDFFRSVSMRFDIVYSIFGAVWFTDPAILLPLVHDRMTPGGVFAFAQLPVTEPVTGARVIRKWNHSAERWADVLSKYGFGEVEAEIVEPPAGERVGTLLVRAVPL